MSAETARLARHLALRVPVVVLVLAFTAIPTALRPLDSGTLAGVIRFTLDVPDIVVNILGYIPLGVVFASKLRWRTIGIAALVSLFAEATQLWTDGRSSSAIDVATNIAGAAIGVAIAARWKNDTARIAATTRIAAVAAVLAVMVVAALSAQFTPNELEKSVDGIVAAPPWKALNTRGSTTPGTLEAHWTFDRVTDGVVRDESQHGLDGVLANRPILSSGVRGRALSLNGRNQWMEVGDPVALRLTGSMTVSAWINSNAFPSDDAAIVSDHSGLGYQLDTTIDEGPRTIAFKLANASGQLMARYGRTSLTTNRWYHVAGVYDAAARSLDVYLNGRLDNGCLRGRVTTRQDPSGKKTFVGRRGNERGFEFAGAIDDVRVYSRALTTAEIADEFKQVATTTSAALSDLQQVDPGERAGDAMCRSTDSGDARVVGLMVMLGMLVAVVCAGLWASPSFRVAGLLLSLCAGLLIAPVVAELVPAYFRWIVPLLTLVGGASVIVSTRVARSSSH